MRPTRAFSAVLFSAVAACVATAQAPDGFRTHDDPALGLRFFYPSDYFEIPLDPTETAARVKYVKRGKPQADDPKQRLPKNVRDAVIDLAAFEVFVIDKDGEPEVVPPSRTGPPSLNGAGESRPAEAASRPAGADDPDAPKNLREAMLAAKRVRGFAEFKKKKLGGWSLKPIGLAQGEFREWQLDPARGEGPFGYCCVREDGDQLLGVYGSARQGDRKAFENAMRKVGRSLKFVDDENALADLERIYKGSPLLDVPKRIEVRRGLARGWKAKDTPNFVIVSHTPNEKLINKTARDIEAIRPFYERNFPPSKPLAAVAIVRICRDQKEYMTYGAPPGSGGFWHPGNEELVLFDYKQTELQKERSTGRVLSDKDSMIVLYHEAFHQYIHYAVGEIAPHDWFNEGHGDYYSGAVVNDAGKVVRIGPSPWRVERARDMATGKIPGWVPAQKLVQASRAEYYDRAVVGNYYAAGWAFVYFLREAPEVKKNPEWTAILDRYFDTLKGEYAKRLAALGPAANLMQKQAAGEEARGDAYRVAFGNLDFSALETAWRAFVGKLRVG